ncbi:hypothetical protein [Kitasatospora sp. NPDC001175]|uniref:hypothetical protein n=1 Tax=Kitasatospora sp. NPDC001175 TaxID=3157103 RepID=UPI003D03C46E
MIRIHALDADRRIDAVAEVDVTDAAHRLLDRVAEAYADNPGYVGDLLCSLADAATSARARRADMEHPQVDVAEWRSDLANAELDGIREALVEAVGGGPVVERLAQTDARRLGRQLLAASVRAGQQRFPHQRDGGMVA